MKDLPEKSQISQGNRLYFTSICLIAALGGFLFGFDTAVISGTIGFVKAKFALDAVLEGWFVSSALVGCICGVAIAGFLSDHFGRKNLMIAGSIGYIVSLGTTAWAFYRYGADFSQAGSTVVLVSLLVFIAAHAFGQGAVIWVFISEIFPNRVRARGQALGSFTHWFMAAAISWTFPVFAEASGGYIFTFYAICMVGQLIWVLLVMPETKGISLEKMQKKLGID